MTRGSDGEVTFADDNARASRGAGTRTEPKQASSCRCKVPEDSGSLPKADARHYRQRGEQCSTVSDWAVARGLGIIKTYGQSEAQGQASITLKSLGGAGTWPKGRSETTRDARGAPSRQPTAQTAEDRRKMLRRWRLQGRKGISNGGFRMEAGTYTITGPGSSAKLDSRERPRTDSCGRRKGQRGGSKSVEDQTRWRNKAKTRDKRAKKSWASGEAGWEGKAKEG